MMSLIVPMGTRTDSQTSRRGLFGRGAEVAASTPLGAAAGTLTRPGALPSLIRVRLAWAALSVRRLQLDGPLRQALRHQHHLVRSRLLGI
jgi:hypothetical protein